MRKPKATYTISARDRHGDMRDLRICVGRDRKYWSVWMEPGEWDSYIYHQALSEIRDNGHVITNRLKDEGDPLREAIFKGGMSKKAEIGGWESYWTYGKGLSESGAILWAETLYAHISTIVPAIEAKTLAEWLELKADVAANKALREAPVATDVIQ